jgi:hypothetical protein
MDMLIDPKGAARRDRGFKLRSDSLMGEIRTAATDTPDNALVVAAQLTRRRWAESRASDFEGRINYGPIYGVV